MSLVGREDRRSLDRVERYDLVSGEWETLHSLNEKRDYGRCGSGSRSCLCGWRP